MKNALVILAITAATLAGQAQPGTGTTKAKPAARTTAKATAPQPLTIPADALPAGNSSYTWTDKQGQRWVFAKTPFGVMKSEAADIPSDSSASLVGVKATDAGDKVLFEHATPFGPVKWEKNKADLNEDERKLLATQASAQNPKQD